MFETTPDPVAEQKPESVSDVRPEEYMYSEGTHDGYTGKLAEERADATAETSEVDPPAEKKEPEAKATEEDGKSEDDKADESQQAVPYHRFQRVNRELKEVKKKAEEWDSFDRLLKDTPGLQEHIQSFLEGKKAPAGAAGSMAVSGDVNAIAKELFGSESEFTSLSREEQILVRQEARLREQDAKIQAAETFRKDQAVKAELAKLNAETDEALKDPVFEGISVDRRAVHKLMLDKGIKTVHEAARLLYMDEILEKRAEARAAEALKRSSAARSAASATGRTGQRPAASAASVSFYDDVLSRVAAKNRN